MDEIVHHTVSCKMQKMEVFYPTMVKNLMPRGMGRFLSVQVSHSPVNEATLIPQRSI